MTFALCYGLVILFTFFCGLLTRKNIIKVSKIAIVFFMGIISYSVYPVGYFYSDILRFDQILNTARFFGPGIGSLNWLTTASDYVNQPGVAMYLWIFTFFNNNGLLRAVTIMLFIICIIKGLNNFQRRFKFTTFCYFSVLGLFLMMFNVIFEIAGIRNFLAFAIIFYAISLDILKSKKISLPSVFLFGIAYLLHPITLLILLVRLLSVIIKNKYLVQIIGIFAIFNVIWIGLAVRVLNFFSNIPFITNILIKLNTYLYIGGSYNAYAGKAELYLTSFLLLIILMDFLLSISISEYHATIPTNYRYFFFLTICFCLGFFQSRQFYLRLIVLLLMLIIPFKALTIKTIEESSNKDLLAIYLFLEFFLGVIMFLGWYKITYQFFIF